MSRLILEPLFQIGVGLSFALLLVIGLLARKAISDLSGRLTAFAVLSIAVGFLFLSNATSGTSVSQAVETFVAAGAAFFLAAVLVTVGLFIRARRAD